jgi:dihydrofolate reductase
VKGDVKTEIEKIKHEPGKDIWLFGGAGLAGSLLHAGLVDELSLAVHPLLPGSGKPLFSHINKRINWTLIDTKPILPDSFHPHIN